MNTPVIGRTSIEQSKLIGKLAIMINEDRKKILDLQVRVKQLEVKNEVFR